MTAELTFSLRDAARGAEYLRDRGLDRHFDMQQTFSDTWEFEVAGRLLDEMSWLTNELDSCHLEFGLAMVNTGN